MAWNKPSNSKAVRKPVKKSPKIVLTIIGLLFIAAVAAVFLWLTNGDDQLKTDGKDDARGRIKDVGKVGKSLPKDVQKESVPNTKSKPKGKMDVFAGPPPTEIKKSNKPPFKLPEVPKRTFSTGLEQQISWIINSKPGNMPPLFIPLDKEDMKDLPAILISKSEIKKEDSEALANCKQSVDFAKKEMMKFIKEGGDPNDFLKYYHDELHRCYEWREEAIRQAQELYDEDPATGREFVKKVNEKFDAEGIVPIERDMFGDEEESESTPDVATSAGKVE